MSGLRWNLRDVRRVNLGVWPVDETLTVAAEDGNLPDGQWALTVHLKGAGSEVLWTVDAASDGASSVDLAVTGDQLSAAVGEWYELTFQGAPLLEGWITRGDGTGVGSPIVVTEGDGPTITVNITGGSGGGAVSSVNGQTGDVVLDADDIDGLADALGERPTAAEVQALIDAAGPGASGVAAFHGAAVAISASAGPEPRDLSGGARHARWGTGESAISSTRILPADGPRLLHWWTEDQDPPDFLGASTDPIDNSAVDGLSLRARWRAISPWHTDSYPQSLGLVQGGNGDSTPDDDQIIEWALGISGTGRIRFTGRGLGNNDFGAPGQFAPGGEDVEVRVDVVYATRTVTAFTRVAGAWLQVGTPAVIAGSGPLELVNDSFEQGIHKLASGYGKGWQSYGEVRDLDDEVLARFAAADAVAADVGPGDSWVGAVDGRTWTLGVGDDFHRVPAIYETQRAAWALGATVPNGDDGAVIRIPHDAEVMPGAGPWSLGVIWTPRSTEDDVILSQKAGPGFVLATADGTTTLTLEAPQPSGTLIASDSGAFDTETDGDGTEDPLPITLVPAGGGSTVVVVDPPGLGDREMVVTATTTTYLFPAAAADFSYGLGATFDFDTGIVSLSDDLGATIIATAPFTPVPGSRFGARLVDGIAYATINGGVVVSGPSNTPAGGIVGLTLNDGVTVTDYEIREATYTPPAVATLGDLTIGEPHTLVSTVDPVLDVWRVRVDGLDIIGLPDSSGIGDLSNGADLTVRPAWHTDLHDLALWTDALPEAEIVAFEALLDGLILPPVGATPEDGATIGEVVDLINEAVAGIEQGQGGVTVHNDLTGRSATAAHPIAAVDGLQAALDAKATPAGIASAVTAHVADSDPHGDRAYTDTQIGAITAASIGADVSGSAASAQAYAVQRAYHTGTQAQSTIDGLVAALAAIRHPRRGRIVCALDPPDVLGGSTTWAPATSAVLGGGYAALGPGSAAGDVSVTWRVWLDAGTWSLRPTIRRAATSAIMTITLGGSVVGTVDGYNASNVGDYSPTTFTGIVVTAPGFYDLVVTNPTRNGSASGWGLTPQVLAFWRTGS